VIVMFKWIRSRRRRGEPELGPESAEDKHDSGERSTPHMRRTTEKSRPRV